MARVSLALATLVLAAAAWAPAAASPVVDPLGAAQTCPEDPDACPVDPRVVGSVVNPVASGTSEALQRETGESIARESVDVTLVANVTNAEIGILGILLGGVKVQSDFEIRGHLAIRAISLEYVDAVIRETSGEANVSAKRTFGLNTSRNVVTAEQFRLIGGGALLDAFRPAQERATARMITESLPGVTVLSSRFEWSNVVPAERARNGETPTLSDPPLILDATFTMQYLDRFALDEMIGDALDRGARNETADDASDQRDALRKRVKENQTQPFAERNAFMIVGIDQLIVQDAPPGWRFNFTMTLPKGFTVEGATDELVVDATRRTVTYQVDGSDAREPLQRAGVVTLSNRVAVASVLFAGTLIAGLALRVAVGMIAAWHFTRTRTRTIRALPP